MDYNDIQKRNPYINYSDNSVPNIQDISKFSRNKEIEQTESELRHQDSSSAIYDQEPFGDEVISASFMVQEILNQHNNALCLAELKNNQYLLLNQIQKLIESKKVPQQRGAAMAPESGILEVDKLFKQLQNSMVAHEQANQKYIKGITNDFKSNLKEILNKTNKYKELCRKHYYRADSYKTKHLHHEFEMKDRILQLENAMDRINVQANKNEELRFEKQQLAQRYENRMAKIESILSKIYQKEESENTHHQNLFDLAKTGPAQGYNNFISFQNETVPDDNDDDPENLCNSLRRITQSKKEKMKKNQQHNKLNKSVDNCQRRLSQFQINSKMSSKQQRILKREYVKKEIKKLNDVLRKFRYEDQNYQFPNSKKLSSKPRSYFRDGELDSEFASLNENIKSFEQGSEGNESESEDPMNKAFVMPSNSHSEDKEIENSPNFDNSPYKHFKTKTSKRNDNHGDQAFIMDQIQFNADMEQENSKQENQVHNHTLEFDVSFSKELAAESPEDMFIKEDNGDLMIMNECQFDKGPPENTKFPSKEEDVNEDNSSIHYTNNNSFNFSNIFNQMKMLDDSAQHGNFDSGQQANKNDHRRLLAEQQDFMINESSYHNQSNDVSPAFQQQDKKGLNKLNLMFTTQFTPPQEKDVAKKSGQIDLSSIILEVSDYQHQDEFKTQQVAHQKFKNKTQQQIFNATMKISEINEISEIKSGNANQPVINAEFDGFGEEGFKSLGISPVNSKMLKKSQNQEKPLANEPSNYFVNLSKDDAESIINLLKDYVTLQLGNGKEIQIPKLNLEVLQSNFPQIHSKINEKDQATNIQNWIIQQSANISSQSPGSQNFIVMSSSKKQESTNLVTQTDHQPVNQSSFQNLTGPDYLEASGKNETKNINDSNSNEDKKIIDLIQIEKPNQPMERLRLVEKTSPEKSPRDFPMNNESPIAGSNERVCSIANKLQQAINKPIYIQNNKESPRSIINSSSFSNNVFNAVPDLSNQRDNLNMINLSNIIDNQGQNNANGNWGHQNENNFMIENLNQNQNYANMLDLTNQVDNFNDFTSSKKVLKYHDAFIDDTLNDREDHMGSFDNCVDNSKDMRNFSGNFSNRGNGICNISGFLNMTNNQSLNLGTNNHSLGGTIKYGKKSGKQKKNTRNNIFENALSIEDNIEGLDQAISNISHISMRSDNRDFKKHQRKKSKTMNNGLKSKKSKQSTGQKYQNAISNGMVKSQRSSHRISGRQGTTTKQSERSKNKNIREIKSTHIENQRQQMQMKNKNEDEYNNSRYENFQQAIIGVGVKHVQKRMVMCKSSAGGHAQVYEQKIAGVEREGDIRDLKFKSFKSVNNPPSKKISKSIQSHNGSSKRLEKQKNIDQLYNANQNRNQQNQIFYDIEMGLLNQNQNHNTAGQNDSSLLEHFDNEQEERRNTVGQVKVLKKPNSQHNPSLEKPNSENKKKIDIKNLFNKSNMKRLDTNLKVTKAKKDNVSIPSEKADRAKEVSSPNDTNFQTPVNVRTNVSIAGAKVIMKKKKMDRLYVMQREPSQNSVEKKSSNKSSNQYLNVEEFQPQPPKIFVNDFKQAKIVQINNYNTTNQNNNETDFKQDIPMKKLKPLKQKIKLTKTTREASKESQRSKKSVKVVPKQQQVKSTRNEDNEQMKKNQLINQLIFNSNKQRINSVKNKRDDGNMIQQSNNVANNLLTPGINPNLTPVYQNIDSSVAGSGSNDGKKIAASKLFLAIQQHMGVLNNQQSIGPDGMMQLAVQQQQNSQSYNSEARSSNPLQRISINSNSKKNLQGKLNKMSISRHSSENSAKFSSGNGLQPFKQSAGGQPQKIILKSNQVQMMHNQSNVSAKNVQKVKLNFKVKTTPTAEVSASLQKGSNASRDTKHQEAPKRAKKLILNRVQKNDINHKGGSQHNNDSSIMDPGQQQSIQDQKIDKNVLLLKLSKGLQQQNKGLQNKRFISLQQNSSQTQKQFKSAQNYQ